MASYPTPNGDGLEPFVRRIRDIETQLRDLQRPSGTNIGSLVGQVQTLVAEVKATLADIDSTVAASITELSYTRAAIDSKVASPGNITPGNVSASGSVSATGDVTVGGALRAPQVPVTILTSAYFATYATTVDGKLGHVPSSARFKQDIRPTTFDPAIILDAEIVDFRYKAEVERLDEGAPFIIGGIAEQFDAAGLGAFVNYDAEGNPFGIAYERLAVGIIPLLQQMHARLIQLETT